MQTIYDSLISSDFRSPTFGPPTEEDTPESCLLFPSVPQEEKKKKKKKEKERHKILNIYLSTGNNFWVGTILLGGRRALQPLSPLVNFS